MEKKQATERLRELLPPGSTVHTILRHVSASGMSRDISPVVDHDDISWLVSAVGVGKVNQKHGGIRMGGCGMDMGFALVYYLSQILYPDGFGCIGEGCPSNDHSNGDRNYTPHDTDADCPDCAGAGDMARVSHGDSQETCQRCQGTGEYTHWHESGGYALRHRWL